MGKILSSWLEGILPTGPQTSQARFTFLRTPVRYRQRKTLTIHPIHQEQAMSTQDERRAKGVAAFNAVYGSMMTAPDEPTGDVFFELMLGNLFADIWAREGLSLRDRRLVLMGAIAAQGEADVFGIQVERFGSGNGLGSGH
jgi:alkylhydroperoxidase/carboxymuconolactone decarboxylase family protein YurZ